MFFLFCACGHKKENNSITKEQILLLPSGYSRPINIKNDEKKYIYGEFFVKKGKNWEEKKITPIGKFELACMKKNPETAGGAINVYQMSLDSLKIFIYNPYHFAHIDKLDNSLKMKVFEQNRDTIEFCQKDTSPWIYVKNKGWFSLKIKVGQYSMFNGLVLSNVFYKKLKIKEYLLFIGHTAKATGSGTLIKQLFVVDLNNFDNIWHSQAEKDFSPNIIDNFDGGDELKILKIVHEPIFKDNDF